MGQIAQHLDREGFLKRAVVREVLLPDGKTICIRALPASMIASAVKDNVNEVFEPANLLVKSLCDSDGKLLFASEETDLVMTVDHMTLKLLLDSIMELNGFSSTAKGDVGQAEKNS